MPTSRPSIDISQINVRDKAGELLQAFVTDNAGDDPRIFARRGGLARVIDTDQGYVMQPLTDRLMVHEAERVTDWVRSSRNKLVFVKADKDVCYYLADLGHWPDLPQLDSVYTSPAILPDGRVLSGQGYDRASKLYMAVDPALGMPPVPRDPTEDQAHAASDLLQDYLSEFRFSSDEDRANAFGMLLAHVLRPLMAASAHLPVFLVDAPTAGSGKGLLINIASVIAQGTAALSQFITGGRDADAEMRKLITSVLLAGRQFVHFDNLEISLKSPALSALMTSEIWSDRQLGANFHLDLPLTTTFAASGNNLDVRGDMGRRVVAIRIDTGEPLPFLRSFRRMDLLGEVRAARGVILGSILTLARRWQVLGCPNPMPRVIMGSFQSVVDVIGGVLRVAEIGGWMGNQLRFAEAENTELTEWTRFVHAWYARWGEQPQLAKTVAEACNDRQDTSLYDALPDYVRPYTDIERAKLPSSLGNFLKARADQIFDGLQLRRAGADRTRAALWQVRPITNAASAATPTPDGPASAPTAPNVQPETPGNARARTRGFAEGADAAEPQGDPFTAYALPVSLDIKTVSRTRKRATSPSAASAAPAKFDTVARAIAMHARAYAHARVSVDTETTGLHVWEGHRLRVLQIAVGDEVGVWDTWKDPEVLEIWRPVLEGRTGSPKVVYHNAKFDLAMLHAAGLKLPPWQQIEDTYLASVLLDNAAGPRPRQTLKALAERHLGRELPKELQKSDWSGEITQDQVDYAAADARATLDLANLLLPKLDAEELRQAYEIEVAVVPIITELGLRGVRIDPLMWAALAENAERANRQAKLELDRIAGLQSDSGTVNWGSWQQVLKLLQARGLQIFSTNEAALTEHAGDELVDALLTYRSTVKSVTTYGVSVLKALDEHERFHADYNQADTRTGRMTADIIHQMPREGGYREAVRPVDGRVLIHADYSQLQVIIVADLAEARSMIEAFNNNVDIHTQTASLMAGIPLERVTPGERQSAKALNFGLLFGAGAATLQRSAARDYGVHWSEAEAQARRNRFFEAYPEIKTWHRKRPGVLYRPELDWPEREVDLPVDLISDSGRRRKGVEKYTEKHNSPVQMMEVDGVKCGLALLDERLKASGLDAQIVMIVHDEVDLEASEADAPAVKELVQQALEEGMNRWLQHTRARIDVDIWRDWKGPKKGA